MPGQYFDWNARAVSQEQWFALMTRPRHVAQTDLGRLGRVSTVWLGLDHGYGSGPPVIFETMVFDGPLDQEMVRYCSLASAKVGHEFMVMRLTTLAGKPVRKPSLIHNGSKPKGAGFRGFRG